MKCTIKCHIWFTQQVSTDSILHKLQFTYFTQTYFKKLQQTSSTFGTVQMFYAFSNGKWKEGHYTFHKKSSYLRKLLEVSQQTCISSQVPACTLLPHLVCIPWPFPWFHRILWILLKTAYIVTERTNDFKMSKWTTHCCQETKWYYVKMNSAHCCWQIEWHYVKMNSTHRCWDTEWDCIKMNSVHHC